MPLRPLPRLALLSATAAVLAGVLVTPAGAVNRPTFALAPAEGGPYPRFAPEAGDTVRGAVRLTNRSKRVRILRLLPVDLATSALGGIEFAPGRPRATGAWIHIARSDVRLLPGASVRVPFTASVPLDADAGEHYAGLVAVDRDELRATAKRPAGSKGVALRQVTRVALPMRFWVPGRATRSVDLRGLEFGAGAGGSRLELDLGNTGRRLVRSTAVHLRVSRDGKQLFKHDAELSEFVPATRISYALPWRGRPTEGEYRLTGTIVPEDGEVVRVDRRVTFDTGQAERLEAQTGVDPPPGRDLPILLIVALALAAIITTVASVGYVRLRRRVGAVPAA